MSRTPLPLLSQAERERLWPALPLSEWQETYRTLHMWMQVVGKIKLELHPSLNHWWHVAFFITSRGMTTGPLPSGRTTFEIDFDFIHHQLTLFTSTGATSIMPLTPRSVADFYHELLALLRSQGIEVTIDPMPCEGCPVPDIIDKQTEKGIDANGHSTEKLYARIQIESRAGKHAA